MKLWMVFFIATFFLLSILPIQKLFYQRSSVIGEGFKGFILGFLSSHWVSEYVLNFIIHDKIHYHPLLHWACAVAIYLGHHIFVGRKQKDQSRGSIALGLLLAVSPITGLVGFVVAWVLAAQKMNLSYLRFLVLGVMVWFQVVFYPGDHRLWFVFTITAIFIFTHDQDLDFILESYDHNIS